MSPKEHARRPFDKTELLLRGQERAPIAVVRQVLPAAQALLDALAEGSTR